MKLQALAASVLAATALIGGSAVAQATMQPIPNPPEKPMAKHHAMKKHHKAKPAMTKADDSMSAPAATPK